MNNKLFGDLTGTVIYRYDAATKRPVPLRKQLDVDRMRVRVDNIAREKQER